MITDPHYFLRRYYLASEDGGMASDTSYSLIFTTDGHLFVRVVKDFEQPYKTPDIREILPAAFSTTTVNGISLSELVAKKLSEILPPPLSRPPQ